MLEELSYYLDRKVSKIQIYGNVHQWPFCKNYGGKWKNPPPLNASLLPTTQKLYNVITLRPLCHV